MQNNKVTYVLSFGLLTIPSKVWYIGVNPVPAAIKNIFLTSATFFVLLVYSGQTDILPGASYKNFPKGPSTLILSPMDNFSK